MGVSGVTSNSSAVNSATTDKKRKKVVALLTEEQLKKLNEIEKDKKNNARRANQKLDKDAFLKLMTTQLKYQNPLEPMDNRDMIAQMAQFSSVEQLNNMALAMGLNNNGNDKIIMKLEDMTSEIKKLNEAIKKLQGGKEVSDATDSEDKPNEDVEDSEAS